MKSTPTAVAILIARAAPPEYRTIPPASLAEMTPALNSSPIGAAADWPRSNADHASSRYSRLTQVNRSNVSRLQIAWTYHSYDGKGNLEANPVIVGGILFAPTAGRAIVAIDGATGKELWRFHPEGRPAFRGLVHWPGNPDNPARLYFPSGDWLYAVDAKTGRPSPGFGDNGRVFGRATVAPAIYQDLVILPCWNEVRAFDLLTGKSVWTFNLVPSPGEFGADTWTARGFGANSWGGMALDSARGIAYISTGSPHPNYLGFHHPGDNLFTDCVVALRARTGERL
ncbi:MAG TPA: PQQ-binding-like beta-propeller repeat protein, partial [Bryobacteraceae bacterium]